MDHRNEKKVQKSYLEKRSDFRVASNWQFSDFLVLGVANFRINYLRQFSFNFENSCAHLAANFLNFPKHPQHFEFWWYWRDLCQFKEKLAFFVLKCSLRKRLSSLNQNFSAIFKSIFECNTIFCIYFYPRKKVDTLIVRLAWEAQFTNKEQV